MTSLSDPRRLRQWKARPSNGGLFHGVDIGFAHGVACCNNKRGADMELLKDKEVAALLSVSRQTVWRWSHSIDSFPAPIRVGNDTPRWKRSEIEAYIEKQAAQ